ncbi:hypothetical protein NPIL_42811 [Nephila pilipes]|uniref:Uncharacterized protein n=1 Tax=Nephila pilipes TaxID=299642 RepID=A0A8X6U445_NEPPI|nr:hypothetical protein NPIL_42811 [Nephila pilipes]
MGMDVDIRDSASNAESTQDDRLLELSKQGGGMGPGPHDPTLAWLRALKSANELKQTQNKKHVEEEQKQKWKRIW